MHFSSSLSYHMPPSLNVCGQGEQKSEFRGKNIVLCPKMDIFSGPKILKSGSAVLPHRVFSNEISHDHSSMYMVRLTKHRAQRGPKGAKKGPKEGPIFFFSLNKKDQKESNFFGFIINN